MESLGRLRYFSAMPFAPYPVVMTNGMPRAMSASITASAGSWARFMSTMAASNGPLAKLVHARDPSVLIAVNGHPLDGKAGRAHDASRDLTAGVEIDRDLDLPRTVRDDDGLGAHLRLHARERHDAPRPGL